MHKYKGFAQKIVDWAIIKRDTIVPLILYGTTTLFLLGYEPT
jgi:hypothetical protein